MSAKLFRCAIYTRKSTEHNLDLEFNSLDAQREACEAYIKSQAHEGWRLIPDHYDDGGLSGASLARPALRVLLGDIRARKIDIVVVYKVDRLTRALGDFAKLVEVFDEHSVSFVSVTARRIRTKGGSGYRYYVSHAVVQGRKGKRGVFARVPGPDLEGAIISALRQRLQQYGINEQFVPNENRELIEQYLDRVTVKSDTIEIRAIGTTRQESFF